MLEVIQLDREAAASLLDGGGVAGHDVYTQEVVDGLHDETEDYVQAFARHRLAERERCAKVAENRANERSAHPEYNMGCWDAAAAIRETTDVE